jgi:hypothetical protein
MCAGLLASVLVVAGCAGESEGSNTTTTSIQLVETPPTTGPTTPNSPSSPAHEWPVASGDEFMPTHDSVPIGGAPVGMLSSACIECQVLTLSDGQVLVVAAGHADIFDPVTGRFAATGSPVGWYSQEFGSGGAVQLEDGRVLLSGAWVRSEDGAFYQEDGSHLEVFDPEDGIFTRLDVPTAFGVRPALLQDGRVLLVGGRRGGAVFDPGDESLIGTGFVEGLLDQWQGSEAEAGLAAPVELGDGRVLIVGEEATLYDPVADSFEDTAPRIHRTDAPAVSMMSDGRVLVAGGYTGWGTISQRTSKLVETYDPVTGTFQETGPMLETREGFVMVALPDGRVLVLGGARDTVEIFDPATGRFTALPGMSRVRHGPGGVLLDDGTVLVAGGEGWSLDRFTPRSAEIYYPQGAPATGAGGGVVRPTMTIFLDIEAKAGQWPSEFLVEVPGGGLEDATDLRLYANWGSAREHIWAHDVESTRVAFDMPESCDEGCQIRGPLDIPRPEWGMYVVLELEYRHVIPDEAGEITLTATGSD